MTQAISTTVRPAGILCGNKIHPVATYHVSVAAVRGCFAGDQGTFSIEVNRAAVRTSPAKDTSPLASTKQLDFLRKLCTERDTTLEFEAPVPVNALSMAQASKLISELLATPKAAAKLPTVQQTMRPAPLPMVAAGRYALIEEFGTSDNGDASVVFYKIDRPTEGPWAGGTFVKVQAGDELHRISDKRRIRNVLTAIALDPRAAMLRYGVELGHCGHCGRTLTNTTSRARGIGPVCAEKMGW